MAKRHAIDTDWYSVKVRLEASYVVIVPANDQESALRLAYLAPVPAGSLYDVDKTATVCGPSCDEIMRRFEERSASRSTQSPSTPSGVDSG
jgi:hypothetical protein